MPKLSVYIGESQVSILSFKSQTDYKFGFYPYSFPGNLLLDGDNEEKFYNQVFKYIKKSFNIDVSSGDLLVGTVGGAAPKFGNARYVSIMEALSSVQNYVWTLVETFVVASGNSWAAHYPTKKDLTFSQPILTNYLSNKTLYPSLIPSSPDTFKAEDVLTKTLAASVSAVSLTDKPMLFTGGRFTAFDKNPVPSYLLALDLLKNPGLYTVKIDTANKLPAIGILNYHLMGKSSQKKTKKKKEEVTFLSDDMLSLNDEALFDDEFVSLGTVLVAPGNVTCLFEKEAGNSQFVELKQDKLFIFPLEKNANARIVVDGKSVGHLDTTVRGGSLGLIIDTRDKASADFLSSSSTGNSNWVKVIGERVSAF